MNEEMGDALCRILAYVMSVHDEYGFIPTCRMLGYRYLVMAVRYEKSNFWLEVESPSKDISERYIWMPMKPEHAPVYLRWLIDDLTQKLGEVPQAFTDKEQMGSFALEGE